MLPPCSFLTFTWGMKKLGRIIIPSDRKVEQAMFSPNLLWCRTLDINENAFKQNPSNSNPHIREVDHMIQYDLQVRTVWEFREPIMQKFKKIG